MEMNAFSKVVGSHMRSRVSPARIYKFDNTLCKRPESLKRTLDRCEVIKAKKQRTESKNISPAKSAVVAKDLEIEGKCEKKVNTPLPDMKLSDIQKIEKIFSQISTSSKVRENKDKKRKMPHPGPSAPDVSKRSAVEEQPFSKLYLGKTVKKISGENLDCDYIQLLDRKSADNLYQKCEKELEYFTGDLAKVRVFGKWFNIPRKQVAYGDAGLTYTFSGNKVPARPWPPFLEDLRDRLKVLTGAYFSFVLVNRYADGEDYIGEHRDDEKDLDKLSPIASISLGQTRLFKFRHGDSRGKNAKRNINPVSVDLKHGSLLMMNYPTNKYWYHSLPKMRAVKLPRINLTFRCIKK
ncbi:DNA oxidative demethylase ALKBH2-like isoform X2 [Anneissia japonica]|nr:DNA oxidative demethylase ALKBH2-like isoform X2 [Anneissia japonica]XP_033113499.1 DNA oxidative demethylase ALKBH2-like isoform X2 [Anneissia japonica]